MDSLLPSGLRRSSRPRAFQIVPRKRRLPDPLRALDFALPVIGIPTGTGYSNMVEFPELLLLFSVTGASFKILVRVVTNESGERPGRSSETLHRSRNIPSAE